MNSNWRRVTLGELQVNGAAEIQTGPFGTVLKASEYSASGVPVISVGEIREGFIQVSATTPRVSPETTQRLPQFVLETGDIVFGRKGAINRNSIINESQAGWFLGSDGIRLRLSNEIDSIFVSYQLRSKSLGNWLLLNSSGSIMPSLNQKILDRLPIWLPEIEVQKQIAKLFLSIDSKIDLNNRINAELEQMAKTLYDYWFVQFDFPISVEQAAAMGKPDLAGKPYKSSGGKMVYNAELKREIPAGWEVEELGRNIEIQRGISYKGSEIVDKGVSMINLNSFNLDGTYKESGIKSFSGKYNQKNIAKSGDLLIAATDVTRNADIIGKAILVPQYYENDIVYSMDIVKIIPSSVISSTFLMMLFNSKHYHNYIKWFASGTLVLHLNLDGLKWYKTEIPPRSLQKRFESFYLSIFQRINQTQKQNQRLVSLRDWLLPMLMNGQVTVQEVEEEVRQAMAAEPEAGYGKH